MDKQKTKFFELLSRQINLGTDKFNFESLPKYLNEAIKALPDGNLKDALLEQKEENSEKLWSLLKTSKKQPDETPFNTFTKKGQEETLKNISTLASPKEQLHQLTQVALSHPSKDLFNLLLNAEAQKTNGSKLETLIKVTELCCRLTVGCSNSEVLSKLMHFFLSEIGQIYEEFSTSSQPDESWLRMKDAILGLLTHCHLKYQRQKEKHEDNHHSTEYRDLLAAILSLYTDVLLMNGNYRDESTLNHVSNVVYLLLNDSPSHILDTVNQISTLDKTSVEFLFPFLRKVLSSTAIYSAEFINYLKYICAARKVLKCLDNQSSNVLSIKKIASTVLPKDGFSSWLSNKDESLVDDLNLSAVSRSKITEHLLQVDIDDDIIERLLDLVAEEKEEGKNKSTVIEKEDKTGGEEMDPSVLFFVDPQGSSELLEQCQEEFSNSKNDKILKKQIDAMLERLEPDSGDENDEYDLNFDEEMGLTERFGKGGTTGSAIQEEQEQTDCLPESMEMSEETPVAHGIPDITPETTQTSGRVDQRKRKRKKEIRRKSTGSIVQTIKDSPTTKRKTRSTRKATKN